MRINKILINIDKATDYIPVASTIANLTALFIKCVVIPRLSENELKNNHYYTHLKNKDAVRCIVLLIPLVGNITIGIYDFINRNKEHVTEGASKEEVSDLGKGSYDNGDAQTSTSTSDGEDEDSHATGDAQSSIRTSDDEPLLSTESEEEDLEGMNFSEALNYRVHTRQQLDFSLDTERQISEFQRSSTVPFHRIFSFEGSEIFLGNGEAMNLLFQYGSNVRAIKKNCPRCKDNEHTDREISRQINNLSKIDLLISFITPKSIHALESQPESNFLAESSSGIQHMEYPLKEPDEALTGKYLMPIIDVVYNALNENKTVFICADRDENSYAEIFSIFCILFSATRKYDLVFNFVNSQRSINNDSDLTKLANKQWESIMADIIEQDRLAYEKSQQDSQSAPPKHADPLDSVGSSSSSHIEPEEEVSDDFETFSEALQDAVDRAKNLHPIESNSLYANNIPEINTIMHQVPFYRVFSYNGSEIFLGNSLALEILSTNKFDVKSIKNKYNANTGTKELGIADPDYSWALDNPPIMEVFFREIDNLSKVDLCISFIKPGNNPNPESESDFVAKSPAESSSGIQYMEYPLKESDEALDQAYLAPIFTALRTALEENKTVFICTDTQFKGFGARFLAHYIAFEINGHYDDAVNFIDSMFKKEIPSHLSMFRKSS